MASPADPVKILEVCNIAPSADSPESATEISLPLTFFDTFWLKTYPVERIFFYEHSSLTATHFNSVTIPKLKRSLSLTLLHFLPLAGSLKWPEDSAKPIIHYAPNDAVPFTVAESNSDFNHLSGNKSRLATDSHHYIPQLPASNSKAAIIALQVTLFPNKGFSIGVSSHHAFLDGKSSTMFIKAWAHICKQMQQETQDPVLLPELLTPLLDRSGIQDPEELDMDYLNTWMELSWPGSSPVPRSLERYPGLDVSDLLRATFELSREDITKLRESVISQLGHVDQDNGRPIQLSTFVLVFAYTGSCIVRAKGLEGLTLVDFAFMADCRARLDPPIPASYFGNCVVSKYASVEAEAFGAENEVAIAAKKLSDAVKGLEKRILEDAKGKLARLAKMFMKKGRITVSVAGSNQFKVYETDFGWGRPRKVEVVSIDRTAAISLADSKDGSGGVEIGLVLKKHEMKKFEDLFINGLKALSRSL